MSGSQDTPLMQQWREVKSRHRDSLVFFRVGDFFELFYQDAQEGSRLLGLTLTSRNNGAAAEVPLAGIPVKALDEYLGRLVEMGKRVAICDQVEDASEADGIVRREVVETVTPGTVLHDALLRAERNNFVVAVVRDDAAGAEEAGFGVAHMDLSTGETGVQRVDADGLEAELGRLEPSELLLPRALDGRLPEPVERVAGKRPDGAGLEANGAGREKNGTGRERNGAGPAEADAGPAGSSAGRARSGAGRGIPVTYRDDWIFDEEIAAEELRRRHRVQSLEAFGFGDGDGVLVRAAGALASYLDEIRPAGVEHLRPPVIRRPGSEMVLDEMTRRNLELVEPLRRGEEGGTLLDVLDRTVTSMGARLLRQWILRPLVRPEAIWARQEAVTELHGDPPLRASLRTALSGVSDLERIAGKLGTGRGSPRELLGLGRSLEALPAVRDACAGCSSERLAEVGGGMDLLEDLQEIVSDAVAPDAPPTLQEGGVIREGYDDELDEQRGLRDGARDFIASLQTRERERTGIGSLKVGFNKVFGYYLEVTKANLDRVPEGYVRKQTLSNAERYFTPELKEWEEKVFHAEDRIAELEEALFREVRGRVAGEVSRIQEAGSRVARLDVLSTLAEVAERRRYVRPEVHTGFEMDVGAGRHPVVETMMPAEEFIPNDLVLDDEGRIVILTGPNMAGKSTVLRQVGLIQLLAQMGSFVPADRARLPVCDRIFTRVGASDNLARGQSTFMVEMNETAAILHGATDRSLVLLDEIGRGTSTYDGVSIAWAVTEHLHESIGAKTVFATHYHELTQLGDRLPGVKNLNVAVREAGEDIVFLRRLEEGGADRSYGVQVARLAGLPPSVVARGREILSELEGSHTAGGEGLGRRGSHRPESEEAPDQLTFFRPPEHPVVRRLRDVDVERTTPLEALSLLEELRAEARGG